MVQQSVSILALMGALFVCNLSGHTVAATDDSAPETQYRVLAWDDLVPKDWEPPVIPRAHNEAMATPVEPSAVVATLHQQLVAIPGFMNETWFKAEQTGPFRGQCAELCGMDHGYRPIVVEVLEPAEFQAWLENEKGGATSLAATSGEQK